MGRFAAFALVCVATAGAQDAVNTAARVKANQQIQQLWTDHLAPQLTTALINKLNTYAGTYVDNGNTKVWILQVHPPQLSISNAPGFTKLDASGIQLRAPLSGDWTLKLKFKVKVKHKVGFFWVTKVFNLTVHVLNLRAGAKIVLDSSDPDAPKIAVVAPPKVDFDVVLWTDKWYLNVLSALFTPKINQLVDEAVTSSIAGVLPALAPLVGQPQPFGTSGPSLTWTGATTDMEACAHAISQKIQLYHMPYGTVVETIFDTPYFGTWEASLLDPAFSPGAPVGYGGFGDSAIWSGHYLAAEAFRYKVTGHPHALSQAHAILDAMATLINMKGTPGLLNRAIQPVPPFAPGSEQYVAPWAGGDYLMHDFISRDQYMGVFFGNATAFDLISDPAAKAKARQNIEWMIDYLLANKWVAYRKDGTISTAWHLNYGQQLAWVLAARRVNPSKYAGAYWQHVWLSDIAWLSPWIETFDPVRKYYKFNLQHGSFYTWLRLESLPLFWQRGYKAFRILRKALKNHQNAHFNMCEAGVAPWTVAGYKDEVKQELKLWLKRKRRATTFDLSTDPGITTTLFAPPVGFSFDYSAGAASTGPSTPQLVSKYPVPVDKRPATDFLWQRDPFRLTSGGNGTGEAPGIDYILPYWMARYYGIFE